MDGNSRGRQVIARIGFAERWLQRAKRHCGEGEIDRGLLTLVLAQAEMHYALETGGAKVRALHRGLTPALLAVGAIGLALLAASWLPPAPPMHSAGAPAPIVKLTAPVGTWLDLVQTPTLPTSAPIATALPRTLERRARPVFRQMAQSQPLAAPTVSTTPAPNAVPVASAITVAPLATVPAVSLSAADLIDLVLAADRTLRKVPANH